MSSTRRSAGCGALFERREGRPWRHARPAGHRRAADRLGRGDQDRAHVMDGRKTYRFTLRFGEARATDDAEGEVIAHQRRAARRRGDPRRCCRLPGRRSSSCPPIFSAIKVDGERAYDLARARRGGRSEPPRRSPIDASSCSGSPTPIMRFSWSLRQRRLYALARPRSGEALGTVGHLSALRRIAVGPFREEAAISLDQPGGPRAYSRRFSGPASVATALDDIPALALTEPKRTGCARPAGALDPGRTAVRRAVFVAEAGGKPVALVRSDGR